MLVDYQTWLLVDLDVIAVVFVQLGWGEEDGTKHDVLKDHALSSRASVRWLE